MGRKRYFVTRHAGAREWALRHGVEADEVVEHLQVEEVKAGDEVMGILPVHLAAEVCGRGARYWQLRMDLSAGERGVEMSATEMERAGARLEEYWVERRRRPMRVQISFLGKVRGGRGSYAKGRYRFPTGEIRETEFFGLALREVEKPDRLVILGTRGSMWHALLEVTGLYEGETELWQRLEAGCQEEDVRDQDVQAAGALLERRLGCKVRANVIPYCRETDEHNALLKRIADEVGDGDEVVLDVTHGFRHLPMLAMASALYLRAVRRARIAGIYYGALDMTGDGVTPVLRLEGLLRIADWTAGVESFERTGDYGVFAPLLQEEGLPTEKTSVLTRAAFAEKIFQFDRSSTLLKLFKTALDGGLPGAGALFSRRLDEQVGWAAGADLYTYQRRLALGALRRADYLRAAIFGYEAFRTLLLEPGADPHDFRQRDDAETTFLENRTDPKRQDFLELRSYRNRLAHADADERGRRPLWREETALRARLTRLLDHLLPASSRRAESLEPALLKQTNDGGNRLQGVRKRP